MPASSGLFADIWQSFRALPLRVIVRMPVPLAAINMAGFVTLVIQRGFTKPVSGGHVIFWMPLVLVLIFARPMANAPFDTYLTALLAANTFSLLFDINDLLLWLGGDRRVRATIAGLQHE
tara:strand:+ start:325 stop:684 length:360 start_codon:yes stop_codon:yes gene_type:complete